MFALVLVLDGNPLAAAERELMSNRLKELSLEELMDIEVTSVSRKTERLTTAAAAITVVTADDIRRSGAKTLPEALRFVPGLHVARRHSSSWVVSSRGFSSVNSEKLLVLSDSRSVYTPLYSGVFWEVQNYLLQDIERVEVIGGPGAALWGSNAVNGVINIITKRAQDTQGLYTEALVGTEQRSSAARFGAETPGGISYRVFGQHSDRDGSFNRSPVREDDWRMSHAGFRADWDASTSDAFTLQGDVYRGTIGQLAPSISVGLRPEPTGNLEADVSGGNVLGRWRHTLDAGSELQLRTYYDRTHRDDPSFRDDLETFDVDFQHRLAVARQQELIWGVNYRHTENTNLGKGVFALQPQSSSDDVFSAFVQDQISLPGSLQLTLGSKFEYNDFSGFEYQPNIRLAWSVSSRQVLWTAVARAVRVPTRLERDIAVDTRDPSGNPLVQLLGNDDFDSEEVLSYEAGYRWQAHEQVAFDLSAFHNRYEGLASLELGQPFLAPDGRTVVPLFNMNLTDGHSTGANLLATWVPRRFWRLLGNYSYIDLSLQPRGMDWNRGAIIERSTPRHQFGLRSLLNLGSRWQLDVHWRHQARIRQIRDIAGREGSGAYSELDVRAAWRATDQVELSLVGQNLLHDRHPEFGADAGAGEIERSVYGKIAWGF